MKNKIIVCLFLCVSKICLSLVTTALPISSSALNFTSVSDSTVNSYSKNLYDIINSTMTNRVITSTQKNNYSSYLNSLKSKLVFYTLNSADVLLLQTYQTWYDYIISKSFVTDTYQSPAVILASVGVSSSDIASTTLTSTTLLSQVSDLNNKISDLNNQITTINNAQIQAKQDLNAARQSAYSAFSTSNLFMRGRLGAITNKASIAYQLVASDGTVLDTIQSGQTSSNLYDLSDSRYCNTELGSMFKLVPYDAKQIEEGTYLGATTGGTIVILCNSVGGNQLGNPYGYLQKVAITRVYPSSTTRAHVVDIGSLVSINQYWQVDFEINPLSNISGGDSTVEVIFPRISMVETITEEIDLSKDLPKLLDVVMNNKVAITQENSSSSDSYPNWKNSPNFWTDMPV